MTKKRKQPQPEVGQNTGSVASASLATTPAEGHTVATPPVGDAVGSSAPRPGNESKQAAGADEISLWIDNNGALMVSTQQKILSLSPAQTLALGDFLACSEMLWSDRF